MNLFRSSAFDSESLRLKLPLARHRSDHPTRNEGVLKMASPTSLANAIRILTMDAVLPQAFGTADLDAVR